MNADAPMCEEAENVSVGVLLTTLPEKKGSVVITEDGRGVDFMTRKNEGSKAFSFDSVVTADNVQGIHADLLQPLIESVLKGYNGALLIYGASTEKTSTLIEHHIIKQILRDLLSRVLQEKEECFISLSFIQFYPDGSAVDLLSYNRQNLKPVTHPVLGRIAGGFSEMCVSSTDEAYTLYETCRETVKASPGGMSCRCSSLFSIAVERKVHPTEVESEVCRSRLQLFSLAGGASRTDLRGVSPLVKALDQIQSEVSPEDKLLPFLLKESLSGNSRTVLLCCIHPQGFLDNETPNALTLAQKVRSLVTKPTVIRWYPRATEHEIRDEIAALREKMMSEGGNEIHNTYRLAELTENLQIVKSQSWEKRQEESNKIKAKRKQEYQSPNSTCLSGVTMETPETVRHLQDQLGHEMDKHIRDGKGEEKTIQEQVKKIQQLRKALGEENLKNNDAGQKTDVWQKSQLEYNKAQERRRQLQEDHGRLIQEEVEKMERELAQEQHPTEGLQRELLLLTKERQVLVLQLEALRAEAQQAERDLLDQFNRHQSEMHCLKEETLQVFRVFRQVSEEQRKMSEDRYRSVLLEAVQDAVYLSAQNQQLQAENKELCKALAELKDALAVTGEHKADQV